MEGKHTRRIILEVIFALLFVGILWHLLREHAPKILKILESGNAKEIDSYLKQYGTEGKYLLVLLQIIETISIVLPAVPVYICSGIMFGKVRGILVCYAVNLLLNLLIFLTARKLKQSTHMRYDISKNKFIGRMLEKAKHLDRVVIAMCLLPVVPNGMIPYMSSQMPISAAGFLKALAIGSLPSIAVYVSCGDFLVTQSYKIIVPVIMVLAILSVLAFIFRKKLIASLEPKVLAFIDG